MEYDLFQKTELTVHNIVLSEVHLQLLSNAVAGVLNLSGNEVLVTDVFGDCVVFDILKRGISVDDILGKERELIKVLSEVQGVSVSEDTYVSSRGLLSWISLESSFVKDAIEKSKKMGEELISNLKRSVIVYSTGAEVEKGIVKDTNAPLIKEYLSREGFIVRIGPTLKDNEYVIASHIRDAADQGYSVVITTGGVGAEEKDKTVEAVLSLDPDASTPVIVSFELGVGRHKHKNNVRIAVGEVHNTRIVSLPGPTDEVICALKPLAEGIKCGLSKRELADHIAFELRKKWESIR